MGLSLCWAKRPLFALAGACVFLLAAFEWWREGLWMCFLLAGLAGFLMARWKGFFLFLIFGVFVVGRLYLGDLRQASEEEKFSELGSAYVEGRLKEDAKQRGDFWSATAKLHGEEYRGASVHWVGVGEAPPAGTELAAYGVFEGFKVARNPGTEDQGKRMRDEGLVAIFDSSETRSRQWLGPGSAFLSELKNGFREGIVAGLDDGEASQVIRAVVLGERSEASLGLIRYFRESGTLHVFTVSGMHVLMLGTMVWFALKWCGVRRRYAVPLIIAAMFFYTWLTGSGPAAVRAAWMGAVFLGAFFLRRRSDLLNSLGVVLVVNMLLHPQMIRMPGVQLSYGVVAAIGLFSGPLSSLFSWISQKEMFLPDREMSWWNLRWYRFRRWLAGALSVSSAAWLGSLPLAAFHFGIVTPISIVATVVLGLQVYVVLGIAMISAVVFQLSSACAIGLNRVNSVVAVSCSATAEFFSDLPGSWIPLRSEEGSSLIVYDLDFGSSAACLVSSEGSSVMIDVGGAYSLEAEVAPSLRKLGLSPDSFLFTHDDAGHAVGPELLKQLFRVKQVASPLPNRRISLLAEWAGDSDEGVRITHPQAGDRLGVGEGIWVEILFSPDQKAGGGALVDDRALIFKVHWGGWKILWLSDAGRMSEEVLLATGVDLRADLVVAGLHDSDVSLTETFLEAVNPQVILIPRPAGSVMDWYRGEQMPRWEKRGIEVMDQSRTGGITISVVGGEMIFEGFMDESRKIFEKR